MCIRDRPERVQAHMPAWVTQELLTPNEYSRPQIPVKQVNAIVVHYVEMCIRDRSRAACNARPGRSSPGYRFSNQQTDSAAKSNAHNTAALCS